MDALKSFGGENFDAFVDGFGIHIVKVQVETEISTGCGAEVGFLGFFDIIGIFFGGILDIGVSGEEIVHAIGIFRVSINVGDNAVFCAVMFTGNTVLQEICKLGIRIEQLDKLSGLALVDGISTHAHGGFESFLRGYARNVIQICLVGRAVFIRPFAVDEMVGGDIFDGIFCIGNAVRGGNIALLTVGGCFL